MKNPQFLPESAETLPIVPIHEMVVFTKFQDNWAKIVDFSLRAFLEIVSFFIPQSLTILVTIYARIPQFAIDFTKKPKFETDRFNGF